MLTSNNPLTLPLWRRWLAYVAVAVMPISVNVAPCLPSVKGPLYFSPLDVLLPVLALLMLGDLLAKRPWARFRCPPLVAVLWAGLAVVSCLWSEGFPGGETFKTCARGALNPIFFGVVATWVFQNVAADAAEYRRLALVLGGSFAVCVLLALKQYVGPVGLPYDPFEPARDLQGVSNIRLGGWYDFRGVFGAQAALLAPAAAAFALLDTDAAIRWAAGTLVVLALCVTLAAGGFLGACAGVLAVAVAFAVSRNWLTGLTALMVLLAVVVVVLPRLPRNNTAALFRGVAFFADDQGATKPTARLRRYQAALDLLAAPGNPQDEKSTPYWVKGVGAGHYQGKINQFYQPAYPKPGRRTDDEGAYGMEADEPFTFGFLETVAVELGLPGLLAVLFLFGTWILSAHGTFARLSGAGTATPNASAAALLALAAFGAGCGALVLSVLANPVIRGVGGSFAFFFAVALSASYWASERRSETADARG